MSLLASLKTHRYQYVLKYCYMTLMTYHAVVARPHAQTSLHPAMTSLLFMKESQTAVPTPTLTSTYSLNPSLPTTGTISAATPPLSTQNISEKPTVTGYKTESLQFHHQTITRNMTRIPQNTILTNTTSTRSLLSAASTSSITLNTSTNPQPVVVNQSDPRFEGSRRVRVPIVGSPPSPPIPSSGVMTPTLSTRIMVSATPSSKGSINNVVGDTMQVVTNTVQEVGKDIMKGINRLTSLNPLLNGRVLTTVDAGSVDPVVKEGGQGSSGTIRGGGPSVSTTVPLQQQTQIQQQQQRLARVSNDVYARLMHAGVQNTQEVAGLVNDLVRSTLDGLNTHPSLLEQALPLSGSSIPRSPNMTETSVSNNTTTVVDKNEKGGDTFKNQMRVSAKSAGPNGVHYSGRL